ncbi:hypothetical protein V8F20_003892 [Naviculisporaceae sp. PSN 640]
MSGPGAPCPHIPHGWYVVDAIKNRCPPEDGPATYPNIELLVHALSLGGMDSLVRIIEAFNETYECIPTHIKILDSCPVTLSIKSILAFLGLFVPSAPRMLAHIIAYVLMFLTASVQTRQAPISAQPALRRRATPKTFFLGDIPSRKPRDLAKIHLHESQESPHIDFPGRLWTWPRRPEVNLASAIVVTCDGRTPQLIFYFAYLRPRKDAEAAHLSPSYVFITGHTPPYRAWPPHGSSHTVPEGLSRTTQQARQAKREATAMRRASGL